MTQRYFKNKNNKLFAIDNDKYCTDEFVAQYKAKHNLVEIEKSEYDLILEELNTPTEEQLEQMAINEAQSYLDSTDFYMTVDKYAQLSDEKRTELETLREEARGVIRSYEDE